MDRQHATWIGGRSPEHRAFGRAIREARARRGISQETAAFHAGLHRNQWGAIERGEANPTFSVLLKVLTGLGLALSAIVTLYDWHLAELSARPAAT